MGDEINLELSKILAKAMQSSYKKKEIEEAVARIMEKMDRALLSRNDAQKIRELRAQFELIRRDFFGLK